MMLKENRKDRLKKLVANWAGKTEIRGRRKGMHTWLLNVKVALK